MWLGGICGLLFVILFIPSYVSAPDTPSTASSIQQVLDYFTSGQSQIVFLNGVLLIFASFFFLWFLGILHALLQHAEHDGCLRVGRADRRAPVRYVDAGGSGNRDRASGNAGTVRQLSQRRAVGLRVARA